MIRFTILYPKTDSSQFDLDYYLTTHIPLVRDRLTPFGLLRIEMERGVSGATINSEPPFTMITGLTFNTADGLASGLEAHGAELQGDIPQFIKVPPLTQVSNVLATGDSGLIA